jgi:hypothetical protein
MLIFLGRLHIIRPLMASIGVFAVFFMGIFLHLISSKLGFARKSRPFFLNI